MFSSTIWTQPLNKAPDLTKQKVKQIVEWVRHDFDQKAKEGGISSFDKRGNLIAYFEKKDLPLKDLTCTFDRQNRLIKKVEWFGSHQMSTFYAYKKNLTIEETKFRGKTYKTFFYKNNKNKIIEKKTYAKGLELGDEFLLKERVLFHYNKQDSLSGEKIMKYDLLGRLKHRYDIRKILHYYSSKSGRRTKTLEYDFDGTLINEQLYEYDKRNRLTRKFILFKNNNTYNSYEYKYKNGKIWQAVAERPGYKDVKVYIDGRLIRLRSYNEEKIIRIVDYQYFYH